MPRNRKLPDEAPILGGGQKDPTDKPDPLVGVERTTTDAAGRAERIARESSKETTLEAVTAPEVPSTEGHGSQAVVDLSLNLAVEADEAAPKDQATSAEAVDQKSVVRPVDVERAELDAATHAERLGRVEDESDPDTISLAITAAGDREGDHVRNVEKAVQAADDAPDNVKRARAFAAVEDVERVDSPHGRTAEEHDAWQAARWAPHGDLNVPAVSYGPEDSGAIYGPLNPTARDQLRGLKGDSENSVERAKKDAGPGDSIARERYEENQAALKLSRTEVDVVDSV